MSGNYRQSETNVSFNNKFNLLYYTVNNVLANLCPGENWKCPLVTRIHPWSRLRYWLMPSLITLCFTPTHTSIRCRLKSFTSCTLSGRLAAPRYFVMKYIEVRAVRWPEVWKFYGSLTLLHFPTAGANDAQNVSVDTARGKDNDCQNL